MPRWRGRARAAVLPSALHWTVRAASGQSAPALSVAKARLRRPVACGSIGANARSADELLDIVRVIWLTPAMDALFTGPAADRRRFLDRLVLAIDTHHGQRALDYEKAMRGRNRLLTENASDKRWVDAIETQMAETGVAIAAARAEMVRLLAAMIQKQPSDGPFPRANWLLKESLERLVHEMPARRDRGGSIAAAGRRARTRPRGGPHARRSASF